MKSQPPISESLPSPLPSLRILIVEDDPVLQLGLKQALSLHPQLEIVGQETEGYSGIEVALHLKPDLVIVDIGLPQLDGIAVTKRIKAAMKCRLP